MTAGLNLLQNMVPAAPVGEPLSSVPSTGGERMDVAWDAAQTPDRYWNLNSARKERAARIIEDYHALTGEKLLNPFDNSPTQKEVSEMLGQPTTAIYAKRLETLRQKTREARAALPDLGGLPQDFLDVDSIDRSIASESGAARAREDRLIGTGGGVPAFLASSAGEMVSPHGVASMFLPVSRLPTWAAEGIGAAWLRNIGKEALLQGALNAGVQLPASVVDYMGRKELGTEQTAEQLVDEVVAAGAGGAILGGLFRAAHLAILKMAARGADIPPAVKDAALVMEAKEKFADKNALNVPPAVHEAQVDRAVVNVAQARPADVADAVMAMPTGASVRPDELPIPEGMVRMYHGAKGADPTTAEAHVTPHYEYARDFRRGDQPNDVWYVDVPANSPWLKEIDVSGTNAPRTLQNSVAPPEVMAEAKLLPKEVPSTADAPVPDWLARNNAEAVRTAEELGLTERVREMAEKGDKTATQISEALNGRLSPDEVRAVRDSLGIAPIGETGGIMASIPPEHAAEIRKLEKAAAPDPADVPRETKVEDPTEGAGRPTEGPSPQDKAMEKQVREMVSEEGNALPEQKRAWEDLAKEEQEARAAAACVTSVIG